MGGAEKSRPIRRGLLLANRRWLPRKENEELSGEPDNETLDEGEGRGVHAPRTVRSFFSFIK